jgi:hypothetical protein
MIERLRRAARFEDLLLAAWLVLVEPLLMPSSPALESAPSTFDGLLGLAGLIGLAVCIGARSAPGVLSGLITGNEIAWMVGPLIGAFALVVDTTIENLAIADAGPVLAAGLVGLAVLARFRVPPLDGRPRRLLVTPFILLSAGAFGEFMSGLRDLFDLRELVDGVQASGLDVALGLFVAGLALLGVLVFYVMLIFAPRQVAEREGSPGTWALRFLLFVVCLTIGETWSGLLRG